jgi:hypothetical protein
MDIAKAKRYGAWLEIIIYLYIGFTLITRTLAKNYLEDIDKNFNKHRQKPCAIALGPLTGRSSKDVMAGSVGQKSTGVFKIFLRVLQPIFKLMAGMFKIFQRSINKIRMLLSPIRNYFYNATKLFYDQIQDFTIGMLYSAHKMRNSMKRSMSGFHLMMHTLEHSRNSLLSVVKSTPVKLAVKLLSAAEWIAGGFLCFDEDTFIGLYDKTHVKIYDIQLGDILEDGAVVIAVQKFKNDTVLFEYDTVYVSGNHMVQENGKWVKVIHSKKGTPTSITPEYLYCLSTTTGTILIKEHLFKDYEGTTNPLTNLTINSLILMNLNRDNTNVSYPNKFAHNNIYLENGFHPNTLIKTNKGGKIPIKDIKMGDLLFDNNEVLGIIKISGPHVLFYDDKGVIVSSNTKTNSDGVWKNIEKTSTSKLVTSPDIAYNLVTSNEKVPVYPDRTYYDYIEVYDAEVERQIEMLTLD